MRYEAPLSSSAAFLSDSAIQAMGSGSLPSQLLLNLRIRSQPHPLPKPAPTPAGDPGQEDLQ